ncbi:calcium-transporting P-type ATPase, PMR1-type [[Eubacterium] cellulosolvens]
MNHAKWHALDYKDVMNILKTTDQGFDLSEVEKRLNEYGLNKLEEKKRISPITIFLDQFKDFLILILIAAVVISLFIDILNSIVILSIVFACVVLGFFQEYRAEKAMEALKGLATPKARVLREGKLIEIMAVELVPGDIILLESGDRIPADARLIHVVDLQTDEAILTGESIPVEKDAECILEESTSIPDRKNIVFMGTVITFGRGRAVVTDTGMNTEFGKIADLIQTIEEEKTPLQIRLDYIGKWLGITFIFVCAIVAVTGFIRGYGLLEMLIWGVSLAVAAIPEALPAVITISLALGMLRMAKRHAIVRRLPTAETLGCTNFICSDKTGTITRNEMTVREIYVNEEIIKVSGVGYKPEGEFYRDNVVINPQSNAAAILTLKIGVLCNNAVLERGASNDWYVFGDPTEGALLVSAVKAGINLKDINEHYPRIKEIPFDSRRKYMATIHSTPHGESLVYMKGAPEMILEKCTHIYKQNHVIELIEDDRDKILQITRDMADRALRVLAMGFKTLYTPNKDLNSHIEENLVFVGLQGMIDPPRKEAKDALQVCRQAGIKVAMITGDHKLTAIAVAKETELIDDEEGHAYILEGTDLDQMDDNEFEKIANNTAIYARVSPEHKVRIVNALKKDNVVAMTGDGVNDAPAVKRADIGIAMGIKGTDVTKEASDMILTDDNFATIVAAVEEGRGIYDNIKKYLAYLLSCNVGEILVVFIASLLGFPLPLTAIQILWVNLTTDGLPALALSVDPSDPDIMWRKPRDPRESIFTRGVKFLIFGVGILMCLCILPIFGWILQSTRDLTKAMTFAFTIMVMIEMFNAFNCRSEKHSIFKVGFFRNKKLVIAVILSILLQLAIIYLSPLQPIFNTTSLSVMDWIVIILISATVIPVVELGKHIDSKLFT